jgi:hypothetical protein
MPLATPVLREPLIQGNPSAAHIANILQGVPWTGKLVVVFVVADAGAGRIATLATDQHPTPCGPMAADSDREGAGSHRSGPASMPPKPGQSSAWLGQPQAADGAGGPCGLAAPWARGEMALSAQPKSPRDGKAPNEGGSTTRMKGPWRGCDQDPAEGGP